MTNDLILIAGKAVANAQALRDGRVHRIIGLRYAEDLNIELLHTALHRRNPLFKAVKHLIDDTIAWQTDGTAFGALYMHWRNIVFEMVDIVRIMTKESQKADVEPIKKVRARA